MMKSATTKTGVGYEDEICHFCGKNEAGYERDERGKTYPACMKCARKSKETNEVKNEGDNRAPGQEESTVA